MTLEEKVDQVDKKLDLLLACFGLAGKHRAPPRELEDWAKDVVSKYRKRKELKSSPGMGKVLSLSGKETAKDECEKSQRA